MSLYGALFSSVAGIRSQSNKVGIISDNIANVNTVGYKGTAGVFETLVTNSGLSSVYSPGGVLSQNKTLISRQGLIQGTDTPTDIAIAGKGFFVVKDSLDVDANIQYTRAGAFRQDSLGNFVNAAGYYLQGWPLDREGRLPGEAGNLNTNSISNLTSVENVNVLAASGNAAQTTTVSLSANLRASQVIFPGASATAGMDENTDNYREPATQIIAPGVIDGVAETGNDNSIQRGDKFTVSTGGGLTYTYRYDGFTYGRSASTGTNGDSGQAVKTSTFTLAANPFSTTNTSDTVSVTAAAHGLATGDVVTLSGQTSAVNGIPATEFNNSFVVTVVDKNTFSITVSSDATSTGTGGDTGLTLEARPFAGNILDAASPTQRFLSVTGTSRFTADALTFTITTDTVGTLSFTYTNNTPNPQLRQFNTLDNLAETINSVSGLTARVSNGRLYVASADANEAISFANGESTGTSGPPVLSGIDWIRELGIQNVTVGENRFHSLETLAALINNSSGLDATLNNALTEATLDINVEDPLDTISFTDLPISAPLATFTSATPFNTNNGSNLVTVVHSSAHSFTTGDIVTLDATGMTGYPTTSPATTAFATTNTSTTVVVTDTAHGFSNGDEIFIDASSITGYPTGTINGIPLTDFDGLFTVANVTANSYEITVATAATSTASGGAGGTFIASPTFNGIPMTDFNGQFQITVTGGTTYTIQVANAANAGGLTGLAGLVVTPPNNTGSLLAELGLVDSLEGGTFAVQSLGPLGPVYDPTDSTKNMASANITPQFSQNIRVYDALGSAHDLQVSFIKTGTNSWAVEIFASDTSEVTSAFANGLLAYGTLTFNGDGSLRSVSTDLANDIDITWNNGSASSSISFDWGTAGEPFGTVGSLVTGLTDGMSQFDSSYGVNFINQNGAAVGQLVSVTFTEEGFVVANYNNGESQALFKIPLADFANPDALEATSGNVYTQSADSGEPNLREAGTSGAGSIQSSALEASNVDLSAELTDLIIAQRSYQANTKLITTSDQLLEELNRTIT